jgi:hypothetical protein
MEQYRMDEQDLWSIELINLRPIYQSAIRKHFFIICKAQTSLGQSQRISKLHLGGGLIVLKMEQYWMDEQDLWLLELARLCTLYQKAIRK